jgi:hypothetical protein
VLAHVRTSLQSLVRPLALVEAVCRWQLAQHLKKSLKRLLYDRALPHVRAKLGCAEVREAAGKRAFAVTGVVDEHIWATMPDRWRETWRVRAVAIVTAALDSMGPGQSTDRR